MSEETTEAAVVAEIARQSMVPAELVAGAVYAIPDDAGGVKLTDTDRWLAHPKRATGRRVVLDAGSFVAYVNRHGLAGTEVYADTPASRVVAVIDAHEASAGEAGWGEHTLTLSLEHTKAWLAWVKHDLGANDGAWFDQQQFAEFIEDRALDVLDPDHARLVEVATRFEATKSADFGSAIRLDNGELQFQYTETVGPKKGSKGGIELPKELKLGLRPYIGGPIYYVWAAFRYRVRPDGLRLGYALRRPETILEAAFADIVTEIRDGRTDKNADTGEETAVHTGIGAVPIFYGRP